MGYYDHHHPLRDSLRDGIHRAADRVAERIAHPLRQHVNTHSDGADVDIGISLGGGGASISTSASPASLPSRANTIVVPCHHIRTGDLVILQGRPCQVIKISTSAATGQHRYLGVDLFGRQLYEESSFASSPSPSVVVQNMRGPLLRQYRVLDVRVGDGSVTAMTAGGDVKQAVPVLDQSGTLERLAGAFDKGRGAVRALVVVDDAGRELVVDYRVVHGSSL